MADSSQAFTFGPYRLDVSKRELFRDGDRIPVSKLVFNLLTILVLNHGRAVSNEEVAETLWPNIPSPDRRLKDLFNRLCGVLDDSDRDHPRYVSRDGDGYFRFLIAVEPSADRPTVATQTKILYVKILHLRDPKHHQPAYRTLPMSGQLPIDVYDEAQFYSLHLLNAQAPFWEWSVVTSGDGAATQIVHPWQDIPDYFDPQLARIRSSHINPRCSIESKNYLVVTTMYNGLHHGHEDVYAKVEANADEVRVIVDFASLPDPKPVFTRRPFAQVELKSSEVQRRVAVRQVRPMVFMASAEDLKPGEILKMKWSTRLPRSS